MNVDQSQITSIKKALKDDVHNLVKLALKEDVGSKDLTSSLIKPQKNSQAQVITREDAVVCGLDCVLEVYRQIDSDIKVDFHIRDGERVETNQVLFELSGASRSILTGERVALNFLQMLSSTATITSSYVEKIKDTDTKILDTRKTIPGFRKLQKYAVICGGGYNHRFGLYDAFLIKENHISACGSITAAVNSARSMNDKLLLEVEVENIEELKEAISAQVDRVMLDNFDLQSVKEAVDINNSRVELEVSGNVNSSSLKEYAKTGVNFISIGALTKNIKATDLSMRISS